MATLPHYLNTLGWFQRSDQDCMGFLFDIGDYIELVIHSVNEEDVSCSSDLVHSLGAASAAATVGMCSAILRTAVCLRFHDHSRNALTVWRRDYQKLSQHVAGNSNNV